MTKYAILHGNYNIYHAEFESYEEAKEYYDEFNYFECSKCELDADDYNADKEHYGQYAY